MSRPCVLPALGLLLRAVLPCAVLLVATGCGGSGGQAGVLDDAGVVALDAAYNSALEGTAVYHVSTVSFDKIVGDELLAVGDDAQASAFRTLMAFDRPLPPTGKVLRRAVLSLHIDFNAGNAVTTLGDMSVQAVAMGLEMDPTDFVTPSFASVTAHTTDDTGLVIVDVTSLIAREEDLGFPRYDFRITLATVTNQDASANLLRLSSRSAGAARDTPSLALEYE